MDLGLAYEYSIYPRLIFDRFAGLLKLSPEYSDITFLPRLPFELDMAAISAAVMKQENGFSSRWILNVRGFIDD